MKTGLRKSSITGFTLLEVLIAVVVLSIGLIGLAALMIQGQKFNRSALHRSQATFVAYDMTDRMRANLAGVTAGAYDDRDTDSAPADPGCLVTGCTGPQMAQYDIFEWSNIITRVLPVGRGQICDRSAGNQTCGGTGPNLEFDITISWNEADTDGNTAVRNYVLRVRP